MTTRNVTRRLGVTQPALYSHIGSLDELRSLVAAHGAHELCRRVSAAIKGKQSDDALKAMAQAYRNYVRAHPDRYLLQLSAPRTPEYLSATEKTAEATRSVLRSYGLSEEQVLDVHTAFRAAVHGFCHLEARNALSEPRKTAQESYDAFVELFIAGVASIAPKRRRRGLP